MAKYDVFLDSSNVMLLEVQADLLSTLNTRVVVPLLEVGSAPKPADRLNPVFTIQAEKRVMATQFLAAVPLHELREKIGSLKDQEFEITAALDMLFSGF